MGKRIKGIHIPMGNGKMDVWETIRAGMKVV
jgi:hypothetical protein